MSKVILYPNEHGGVAICYPAIDCGITVEEIASKDVPAGLPYLIVNEADVPSDRTFFDAFEADFTNPSGYAIGPKAWFIKQYAAKIATINTETAPEQSENQSPDVYNAVVAMWEADKTTRIAQLNAQIATQQAEMSS